MNLQEFLVTIGFDVSESQLNAAETSIKKVGNAIVEVGVVALASVVGIGALVASTAEESAEFTKLAEVMGVSVEVAQQWSYAMGKAGLSTNDMIEMTAELAENMGEAADSATGEAAGAFKSLGLNIKNANGQIKQTPQFFEEIADAYAKEKDARKRANFLTGAFGEQGIKFGLAFKKGAAGVRELREEAENLGIVFEGDVIRQGVELSQTMSTFEGVLRGLKNTISAELVPVVNELLKEFVAWYKANQSMIKQRITVVFRAVGIALKAIVAVLKTMGAIIIFVIDNWKWFALILTSIVLPILWQIMIANMQLIISFIAVGIEALAAGYKAAAAWVAAAAPLLAYAALIALVLLILEDIYGWYQGKDSLIGRVIDRWKVAWQSMMDQLTAPINDNDVPFLKAIKWAVQEVKYLIEQLEILTGKSGAESPTMDYIQKAAAQAEAIKNKQQAAFNNIASAALGVAAPGSITPEQQAAFNSFASGLIKQTGVSVPASITGAANNAKTVNNNQKIEIKIDGSKSPEETGAKVYEAVKEYMGGQALDVKGWPF